MVVLHRFLTLIVGVWGCTFETDIDYKGNDIKPIVKLHAANASECCALCAANAQAGGGCSVWTLQFGIGCYLKTGASGRQPYAGSTSGSIDGPAPPPAPTPPPCTTAEDCSLGGACHAGKCVCDAMWTGPKCVSLNLVPAKHTGLWNGSIAGGQDLDASWGGNVVFDTADSKWHLFYAEFLNRCPLGSWGTNSVVSHAIGDLPQGPYVRKETVQGAFHHNPTVAYDAKSQTFLLLSIGAGNATVQNCTKGSDSEEASVGGTPANTLGDPAQAGIITLSHSKSANGPWVTLTDPVLSGRPGKWDAFVTNPSVYVFENGTVLMAYRGGWNPWHVGIARADSWESPFSRVSDAPAFDDIQEDPGIFRDRNGNFHILTHDFGQPTGGHAFSKDGLSWTFAGNAYGTKMEYDDGTSISFSRRERPQVLSLDGHPSYLFTGVQPQTGLSHTQIQAIVGGK